MNTTWALAYTLVSIATLSIIFIIFRHVNYGMGSKRDIDAFRNLLMSFMGFVLCNGVCVWANYYSLSVLGTIFSGMGLIAICATAYYWFYYIEVRLKYPRVDMRRDRFIMLIPMQIVTLLIIVSPFTHLIYYYDSEGNYCRGKLYPIILISAAIYLITATLQTRRKIGNARTRLQKKQYYNLMLFIVFPFLAGVIDCIHAHIPAMELSVLFGIVLIYLNLQDAQVYRDGLTGLYNRRLAEEFLEENVAFASEEKPIYFFLADIDHFKSINDRFGHLEGDRALKLVADVFEKYEDNERCYVSRWGGDEMVIIVDTEESFDPDDFIDRFSQDIEHEVTARQLQYDISLSVGYVRASDPDMKIDEIIRNADQRMYVKKAMRN